MLFCMQKNLHYAFCMQKYLHHAFLYAEIFARDRVCVDEYISKHDWYYQEIVQFVDNLQNKIQFYSK